VHGPSPLGLRSVSETDGGDHGDALTAATGPPDRWVFTKNSEAHSLEGADMIWLLAPPHKMRGNRANSVHPFQEAKMQ